MDPSFPSPLSFLSLLHGLPGAGTCTHSRTVVNPAPYLPRQPHRTPSPVSVHHHTTPHHTIDHSTTNVPLQHKLPPAPADVREQSILCVQRAPSPSSAPPLAHTEHGDGPASHRFVDRKGKERRRRARAGRDDTRSPRERARGRSGGGRSAGNVRRRRTPAAWGEKNSRHWGSTACARRPASDVRSPF